MLNIGILIQADSLREHSGEEVSKRYLAYKTLPREEFNRIYPPLKGKRTVRSISSQGLKPIKEMGFSWWKQAGGQVLQYPDGFKIICDNLSDIAIAALNYVEVYDVPEYIDDKTFRQLWEQRKE